MSEIHFRYFVELFAENYYTCCDRCQILFVLRLLSKFISSFMQRNIDWFEEKWENINVSGLNYTYIYIYIYVYIYIYMCVCVCVYG